MESIVALLIIIISFSLSASKNKKKRDAAAQRSAAVRKARPAAPARAPVKQGAPLPPKQESKKAESDQEGWEAFPQAERKDGSIDMPPIEPHEHEGKPMPCPAEERELPRPRPAQQAQPVSAASGAGWSLDFSRSGVVQGVVMAEVLSRPKFENGRRVIR